MRRALDTLDEAIGWRRLTAALRAESAPRGLGLTRVFGATLLVVLALQFVTGLALALHYAPTRAWESVFFIESSLFAGRLVRALHHHGASFLVGLALLHMLRVAVTGGYRPPRELTWYTGLGAFLILLAMALTGYLLPWDERGYGATRVATGLLALTPVAGESLRRIALGGDDYGQLTLTRFYALHISALPLLLIGMLTLHLSARRRHGLAPALGKPTPDSARRYWPHQALSNLLAATAALLALLFIASAHDAPLSAPADPSSSYPARPEWYFLPLFQLLKQDIFGGPREVLGSHVLPGLLLLFLALIPRLDRGAGYDLRARARVLLPLASIVLGALFLSLQATSDDRADPSFANQLVLGDERARAARALAAKGVPPEGALRMLQRSAFSGAAIYSERCSGCHEGPKRKAPDLRDYLSIDWVAGLIQDPNAPRYFGLTKLGEEKLMTAYALPEAQRRALASFLLGRGAEAVRSEGLAVWRKQDCSDCHELEAGLACGGPNLFEYGSASWLRRLVQNPGSALCYGPDSEMPGFAEELSDDQLEAVVRWLLEQGQRPARSQ